MRKYSKQENESFCLFPKIPEAKSLFKSLNQIDSRNPFISFKNLSAAISGNNGSYDMVLRL